ncbi:MULTISPECIES: exodeoxyribonuclease VII small subunit [Gammaproteobacteria]|uniref:exodeoxyribonuclease VII small subunit n=1 Tax=Gammaproteobacteria TaxID=1236 RepID=UPI001AD9BD4E|nr:MULTISPECIES: exodeoxyribonuclease VII small subunit [Gammaproteobacteria]MBO9481917.1 exodeoxyribonuclease VII small subunit [Salinisphaera sp. G21_0]MBO9494951.1 exodeoxyribonuclease VII small subunit [Thalassotalea sp. G20_0]
MSKNTVDTESFAFEQSLAELETLVQKMESGDLSLEESLKAFEQGIKLTRGCQKALTDAEQKVQQLLAQNGELTTEPFAADGAEPSADRGL